MITITTTITNKDGAIELRSEGKGDKPTQHEETVASLIAGAIGAVGRAMSGEGCGECDACKENAAAAAQEGPVGFAMPALLNDRTPSA